MDEFYFLVLEPKRERVRGIRFFLRDCKLKYRLKSYLKLEVCVYFYTGVKRNNLNSVKDHVRFPEDFGLN